MKIPSLFFQSHLRLLATAAIVSAAALTATAAPLPVVLYDTDFETDQSANFTTIKTGATPNGIADYFYSYSGFDGRSGKGMYYQVKTLSQSQSADPGYAAETGAAIIGGALNQAALGGTLPPSFRLNFDIYTSSAPPGSGTTEFGTVWANGDGVNNFAFAPDTFAYYKTTDGDSGSDYRLYKGNAFSANGVVNVPAGGVGWKQWQAIEMNFDLATKLVTVSVDGAAPFATASFDPGTFVAGVPTFAHSDGSGNSSGDASAQFVLFDNLVVTPSPSLLRSPSWV